jgi:hypothetical protein
MASYARLARAAYNTEKYSGDYDGQGYVVDQELSDADRVTFFNPASKRAVVSFRGTKLTNLRDLATDLEIVKGTQNNSARFRNSNKTVEKAIQKYGKDNVSLTGHSLGGSQAITAGQRYGLIAHAFNPGVGPRTAVKQAIAKLFGGKKVKSGVNIYHTGTKDWISALSPLVKGNVRRIAPKILKNPHSVDNFIF